MEKQFSWKRTEDIEIELLDLLRRLCRKWKQAIACAVAGAVILGGYGWIKGRGSVDADMSGTVAKARLTEEEGQAVMAAVQLNNETGSLEEYLGNSLLMQADPYHRAKVILLYCIDHAKRQELPRITESYLNYIINGGAADELKKCGHSVWELDKSYLAELMTAYQKTYSSPYQVVVEDVADSSMLSETLFYVEITGKNTDMAGQMAKDVRSVLEVYAGTVIKKAGSHKLTLISTSESVTADNSLQAQQREKRALLSSNKTSLKAMTDAFSEGQMKAYQEQAGIEEKGSQEETAEVENAGAGIIYIFLGFAGGIFVYCGIFACLYMFRDTVKSAGEMKRMYRFPFYGEIQLQEAAGKRGRKKARLQPDANSCSRAQVLNRIRLACKKQGVARLYAASDFIYRSQEKECLEGIASQLKGWGIELAATENASLDTASWDRLAEAGNVLMVCRIGKTTHRMIDDAMNFYLENGISVLGAVAFSEDI